METSPIFLEMYPEKVENVRLKSSDGRKAVITWGETSETPTMLPKALLYAVRWWNIDKPDIFEERSTHENSFALNRLEPGAVIGFKVLAENSGGRGEFSDILQIEAAPKAPLRISVSNNLKFNEPTILVVIEDSDPIPKTYIVTVVNIDEDDDVRTVTTKQRKLTIRNLRPSSSYEVSVVASKGDFTSLPTRCHQDILTVPGKVCRVRHELSSRTFEIKWQEEIGVESYEVQWRVAGSEFQTKKCAVNEIVLNNLEHGVQYHVRVVARNRAGCGHFSDIYKFETNPPLPLPENVRVSNNKDNPQSAIDVSFDEPASRQKTYRVIARSNEGKIHEQKISSNETVMDGLQPGQEYVVFVHSGDRDTAYSNMARARAIWTVPDKIGDIVSFAESQTTRLVKWTQVAGATGYEVEWGKIGSSTRTETTEDARFPLRNLEAGSEYVVQVCGKNSAGRGRFSEKMHFKTVLQAPSRIVASLNMQDHHAVEVKFDEPRPRAKQYRVRIRNLHGQTPDLERIAKSPFISIDGLLLGEVYRVYVYSEDPDDPTLASEEAESNDILTYPDVVENIEVGVISSNQYSLEWDSVKSAEEYELRYKVGGEGHKTLVSKQPHHVLSNLRMSADYTIRIRGRNSSGWGQYSEEKTFKTVLSPPENIRINFEAGAANDAIQVAFDAAPAAHMYKVTARPYHGVGGIVQKTTHKTALELVGLLPGKKYKVILQSINDDDKNLNSNEVDSEYFYTGLPRLDKPVVKLLGNGDWKVSWEKQSGAESYVVQWGIENENKNTKPVTEGTQLVIKDTKPGKKYLVEVVSICNDIAQEPSENETFTTVPSAPQGLQYDLVSTEKIHLCCNSVEGATKYEFEISSEDAGSNKTPEVIRVEEPSCLVTFPFEMISFKVRAGNEGGTSTSSPPVKFRQVIQHLKKRFKKRAVDALPSLGRYLQPLLIEWSQKSKIEVTPSLVKAGETASIFGPPFSGKTSLCHYLIQSLPECQVAIFLDFLELRNHAKPISFGELLKSLMPDLTEEEVQSLLSWMKENQELVLFVVDNVRMNQDSKPPICSVQTKESAKNLVYNLLMLDRNILPKSRIVCTTMQLNLFTFIKPTSSMKLLGLGESGKTEMWEILLQNNPEEDFSHLKLFLCSPGVFKVIIRLANDRKQCDFSSKASVLIECLTRILEENSEPSRTASLNAMKQKIERLKSEENDSIGMQKVRKTAGKAGSSTRGSLTITSRPMFPQISEFEDTAQPTDSRSLEDIFLRAIQIALVTDISEYEKSFQNNSRLELHRSESFKISSGLLREETMKKACNLLCPHMTLATRSSIRRKRNTLKLYISRNAEAIKRSVYTNCKVTLDWMDCCVELGDQKLLAKCSPHIKVKRNTSEERLRQIENFLRSPSSSRGETHVSIESDIAPATRLRVDTAIRENPNADALVLDEYTKEKLTGRKSRTSYSIAPQSSCAWNVECQGF